jgi:protein TonB
MKRLGIPGEVDVNVVIDPTGRVIDAQVVRSTDPAFDDPALEAVKQWTFKPAKQNGVPSATRILVPIQFAYTD